MSGRDRSRLASWLSLWRAPLAASALCDVAAGSSLAGGFDGRPGFLALAGSTSLCLYACGMTLNGLVDLRADRVTAPSRPLPRGDISPRAAVIALVGSGLAALALAIGLGLAGWSLTLAILLLIVGYHLGLKRHLPAGVICLGSIRSLNMGLGLVVFAPPDLLVETTRWLPIVAYGLYAGAVSTIAAMEDDRLRPRRFRIALTVAICTLLGAAFLAARPSVDWRLPLAGTIAALCFAVLALAQRPGRSGRTQGVASLRPFAGSLLMGFYVFDAAVAAGTGRPQLAAAILLAFMTGRWASRSLSPS